VITSPASAGLFACPGKKLYIDSMTIDSYTVHMKMSELSERSAVPVPTIKFYLREGLLAPGERTSPNQAAYDESHVQRLRLVRVLIDVAGLSVASVAAVLAAIDDEGLPLDWAFGIAQRAVPGLAPAEEAGESSAALDALLSERGWAISAANPGHALSGRVLEAYGRLGLDHLAGVLDEYMRAAEIIAAADLAAVAQAPDRASMVETVVVGTALGDSLLAGLRRIAQEEASHAMFPSPPEALDLDVTRHFTAGDGTDRDGTKRDGHCTDDHNG